MKDWKVERERNGIIGTIVRKILLDQLRIFRIGFVDERDEVRTNLFKTI